MSNEVILRLNLIDVYGKPLKEKVDIFLRHQVLSEIHRASASASATIDITGLRGAPQGLYLMNIDPPSYQFVTRFINLKSSGVTPLEITFPIDPRKVREVKFPGYAKLPVELRNLLDNSDQVLSFEGKKGKELYDALDDISRAGLLNMAAKTGATPLTGGGSVLSYVRELLRLRGDRFYAVVPRELRERIKNSIFEGLFNEVSGSLHDPPSGGYSRAGSFKTREQYGNLQVTFFTNGEGYVADIDIDDAAGIEHVFQVLGNKLSGKPTHPYNIHEILVGYQHIDPGYSFVV